MSVLVEFIGPAGAWLNRAGANKPDLKIILMFWGRVNKKEILPGNF